MLRSTLRQQERRVGRRPALKNAPFISIARKFNSKCCRTKPESEPPLAREETGSLECRPPLRSVQPAGRAAPVHQLQQALCQHAALRRKVQAGNFVLCSWAAQPEVCANPAQRTPAAAAPFSGPRRTSCRATFCKGTRMLPLVQLGTRPKRHTGPGGTLFFRSLRL